MEIETIKIDVGMSWQKKYLTEICKPKQWKVISQSELTDTGYLVYGANGKMGFYHEFNHETAVLLIGCRGSCGSIHISEPFSYTNGNAMACDELSPDVDIKFLKYFLEFRGFDDIISGGVQKQITIQGLNRVEIPLPPLATQKRIAEILDAADALRRKDQELLKKYDELAQAIFIDMFGDPVKNEKGWEFVTLKDFGEFKNGLNFNKQEEGVRLLYLGVGDFKAKYKIDNVTSLSSIELNNIPNEDFLLKDGDLIFVRSNGNKDLVGRCVQVFPRNEKVTFSGFCIRYRVQSNLISSTYLAQLFRSSTFKAVVFNGGRGANINNINQGILSEIKIPLPNIELQQKFKSIQEQLEKQISIQVLKSNKVESLFSTLIQKAFKGELVS